MLNIRMLKFSVGLWALLAFQTPALFGQDSRLIVDWGHDWGVGWFRETPERETGSRARIGGYDVDGDGQSTDDAFEGWDYSWEIPFSPVTTRYDTTLPNNIFYGGAMVGVADVAGGHSKSPSEGHINQNHELRDDWNLMAMPSVRKQPEAESYNAVGLWMWKKADFLNGGCDAQVAFAGDDYLAVFVSRYYGGLNWCRWVVLDNGQFYVSEDTFADQTTVFTYTEGQEVDGSRNPVCRASHVIKPAQSRWAPYTPASGGQMFFDVSAASFSERRFADVEAVGFMTQRDLAVGAPAARALSLNEPIALKFNAVQAVATINLPQAHSSYVAGGPQAQGLWASAGPVSYLEWVRVWKWAVTNQRASRFPEGMEARDIGGYTFLNDGTPGLAATGRVESVALADPLSMVSWWDAVAWCNALSELEGRTPAYYVDASFTEPLRELADRAVTEHFAQRPTVYWNQRADGYRLPTAGELSALPAWAHSDLFVYFWPEGRAMVPGDVEALPVARVAGQGAASLRNAAPFPVEPFAQGLPEIGFGVVRGAFSAVEGSARLCEARLPRGQAMPSAQPLEAEALKSLVAAELPFVERPGAGYLPVVDNYKRIYKAQDAPERYDLSFARSEVSYHLWQAVRLWAQNNGYTFNHSGDVGSLHYLLPEAVDSPRYLSEPVTNISWLDAVVWCNALSELMGMEPVYIDKATGQPVRLSTPFRLNMYQPYHYPNEGRYQNRPVDTASVIDLRVETGRNGFRLPAEGEIDLAGQGRPSVTRAVASKSYPVTSGTPWEGLYGLDGNVAEWTYGGSGLFGQNAFGSDFGYPNGGRPHRMNSQEHPLASRFYLGLRPVHRVR